MIAAPKKSGRLFFFAVVLADRCGELVVKYIERLRQFIVRSSPTFSKCAGIEGRSAE